MTPTPYLQTVIQAADFLSKRLMAKFPEKPRLALILGSGLGEFADSLTERIAVPFSAVPHFPQSSVTGHSGNVVLGRIGSVWVLCLQGRVHYYEGHDIRAVTFPVRVLGILGIRRLIVTNASGGINPRFRPGDLMLIRDHISLFYPNPLIGSNEASVGPRFPDMSAAYSEPLRQVARHCARRLKFSLKEGVYVSVTGPSYESPAEIRMLKRLGADAVGMSTVPEVIVARHMGMECLGISNITNPAAGISKRPLSHAEVLEAGERVKPRLMALLAATCEQVSELD
ncbi:MAG: purine-nucleoside phosphorylase [Acidobacteria bacterium]|nr:purine-nucleoside phosphorylase [Acidobacteriota bacterium]